METNYIPQLDVDPWGEIVAEYGSALVCQDAGTTYYEITMADGREFHTNYLPLMEMALMHNITDGLLPNLY